MSPPVSVGCTGRSGNPCPRSFDPQHHKDCDAGGKGAKRSCLAATAEEGPRATDNGAVLKPVPPAHAPDSSTKVQGGNRRTAGHRQGQYESTRTGSSRRGHAKTARVMWSFPCASKAYANENSQSKETAPATLRLAERSIMCSHAPRKVGHRRSGHSESQARGSTRIREP
ncbi:hypothetical protein MTO96_009893 [Rhipicephalus appendiculatus]